MWHYIIAWPRVDIQKRDKSTRWLDTLIVTPDNSGTTRGVRILFHESLLPGTLKHVYTSLPLQPYTYVCVCVLFAAFRARSCMLLCDDTK